MSDKKTSVLFVCLGNICRSPMAEAVFRAKVQEKNLADQIVVQSCGMGDWHIGAPPHEGTRSVLDEKGISYEGQKAKNLSTADILSYDYIVAMDNQNVADLVKVGVPKERIHLLSDFMPGQEGLEVPDPYYHNNFDEVFDIVSTGTQGLLDHILAQQAGNN